MTKGVLVRCSQCHALAFLSSLDQAQQYHWDSGEWRIAEHDDAKVFMEKHEGHPTEELKILRDTLIGHQEYLEPVKTTYFEATNGSERFVVKRFRESVLDPFRYELIPGRLCIRPRKLRLDRIAVRHELERAVSNTHLTKPKIRQFVQHLGNLVSRLRPEELRRVPFEGHNPSIWRYYLDEKLIKMALQRASGFLDRTDARRVRDFVRQNLKEEPFLAVARVDFHIRDDRLTREPTLMTP